MCDCITSLLAQEGQKAKNDTHTCWPRSVTGNLLGFMECTLWQLSLVLSLDLKARLPGFNSTSAADQLGELGRVFITLSESLLFIPQKRTFLTGWQQLSDGDYQ